MLAVKAVLALDDAGVQGEAQLLGGLHQGVCHLEVRHRRELNGGVPRLVCSYRMAPVATTTSPDWTFRSIPPQVPVRMNVSAPHLWSSSIAMEAEGPPMPVEQAVTFSPAGCRSRR